MTKPIDPQACLRRMWERAPKLAQARGNLAFVEKFRESLKAQIMRSSDAPSIAAKEIEALSHADYIAHIKGLEAATEEYERLRWEMVIDQAAVDVWRTQEASNRGMDRGTQ